MNDVVNKSPFGTIATTDVETELLAYLEQESTVGARNGGDVQYMSFSGKTGSFSIGQDKRDLEEGEAFLVAIGLFMSGYMAWKGGRPIDVRMAGARQPKIMRPDPEEGGPFDSRKGEGWALAKRMCMRSLHTGEEVEFTNNSKSGVAEITELQKLIAERVRAGEPGWPIVTVGKAPFEAQGFKNFRPVLTPIKWLTRSEAWQWGTEGFDPMTWLEEVERPRPVLEKPGQRPAPRRRVI